MSATMRKIFQSKPIVKCSFETEFCLFWSLEWGCYLSVQPATSGIAASTASQQRFVGPFEMNTKISLFMWSQLKRETHSMGIDGYV